MSETFPPNEEEAGQVPPTSEEQPSTDGNTNPLEDTTPTEPVADQLQGAPNPDEELVEADSETVDEVIGTDSAKDQPISGEDQPIRSTEAYSDEVLPLIRVGAWVRLKVEEPVTVRYRGRIGHVTDAPVVYSKPGEGVHSPGGYEYQEEDAVFLVKFDDTGEEVEFTRAAFDAWAEMYYDLMQK